MFEERRQWHCGGTNASRSISARWRDGFESLGELDRKIPRRVSRESVALMSEVGRLLNWVHPGHVPLE